MGKFDLHDYVDVAERMRNFFASHPDGSIQCDRAEVVTIGERTLIAVVARAYRTPDDPRPGVGQAWEPYPGKTTYTKDSEAMNAETSAVGRALAFVGFSGKKVASADEVRNRAPEGEQAQRRTPATIPAPVTLDYGDDDDTRGAWTRAKMSRISTLLGIPEAQVRSRLLTGMVKQRTLQPGQDWLDADPQAWHDAVVMFERWAEEQS